MPSGSCRTIWSSRWTASVRLVCSVSTTCFRASSACVCSRSLSISLICSSSLAISVLSSLLRLCWFSIWRGEDHVDEHRRRRGPRIASPIASETNWRCRACRFCSRCGRRLMRIIRSSAARGRRRSAAAARPGRAAAAGCGRTTAMLANGLAITVGDAGALGDELVESRAAARSRRPARSGRPGCRRST